MPEHTPAPSPARSIYGFVMYLWSKTALMLYFAWAFLPDEILNSLNIYYYPQKYWAVSIPILCLVSLTLFAFFIYPGLNCMLTPRIDAIETVTDEFSISEPETYSHSAGNGCRCKNKENCTYSVYNLSQQEIGAFSIPNACDLDIRDVCRRMYYL